MTTLVSIIMPAYKAQAFIERAVLSLINQTYPHWELLLVSDDHFNYLSFLDEQGISDQRIQQYYSEAIGSGPNSARNTGLANASGELIAPLDADDYYYPERLGSLVPLALAHGVATDNTDVCDNSSQQLLYRPFEIPSNRTRPCSELELTRILELSTPLLLVFKRELLLYDWNPAVKLGEDTLFNLRIVEAAGKLVLNHWPMHCYSLHQDSICHRPDAAQRAEQAYTYCIEQLETTGMGFSSQTYRQAIKTMLLHKRQLNRQFNQSLSKGFTGNFQEFISQLSTSTTASYELTT